MNDDQHLVGSLKETQGFLCGNSDCSKAIYEKIKEVFGNVFPVCFGVDEIIELLPNFRIVSLILDECTYSCINQNMHACFISFIHIYRCK